MRRDFQMPGGSGGEPLLPVGKPLLTLAVYDAAEAMPREIAEAYYRGFYQSFLKDPSVFSYFELDDILCEGRGVAVASENGSITAGFYYVRSIEDNVSTIYICGMWSLAQTRECIRPLIARAGLHESRLQGRAVGALADVRVQPDGQTNGRSAAALTECGLSPVRFFTATPMAKDAHLNPTYQGCNMAATPRTFMKACTRILREWGMLDG